MPSILMCFPKIARAPVDSCRNWNRIMCVFQHHCRQEPWHPFLDGVRETVNEGAYANDSGVPLTNSSVVNWRYAIRELNLSRQFDKSVLDQRVDKIKRRCDY